jgi:hypothetical protein
VDAFATTAQLAAFLGVAEAALPADADRLLDRASEFIDTVSRGRYSPDDEVESEVIDRMVKATCAQVEFWIENGEGADTGGAVVSYRAGSVSVTRSAGSAGSGSSTAERLAPRARDHLFRAGMLNSATPFRVGPGFDL